LTATTLTTGGRLLRYVQAGVGDPVVVFEAGLGACASEWVTVQRLVSATTRTVAYDRAGHGGSTEDPLDRSLARICEDLDALVQETSPDQAVVLVAHSWGGPIVRCYAAQHPERVAGVVLVDATVTALLSDRLARTMPHSMALTRPLQPLLRPLVHRILFKNAGPELPTEDRAVLERDLTSQQSTRTAIAEARAVASSLPLLARWEQAGLPNVPVISLQGAGLDRARKRRKRFNAAVGQEMTRHPQGECRVIEGTDHTIPQDKPRETAQAVLDVVARSRGHKP
jgi:pimeloyl-ACP methyl ester carboxylesterase